MTTLVVSEVFGPTLQGEGPHLGERAAFIRLGGCNLHCSWCDTPYTWDADRYDLRAELNRRPVATILDQVYAIKPKRVIITGGEPLLHQQQSGWADLLDALGEHPAEVEIETNATITPTAATVRNVDQFNASPKLEQGDPEESRIKPDTLANFAHLARSGQAVLKIVCRDPADVEDARDLAITHGFPLAAVYVMPEGQTADEMIASTSKIADAVVDAQLNLTTRLHVLAWGAERGR